MRHHHALKIRSSHHLYTLCVAGFLFNLQVSLPAYINSSFMGQFVSEDTVSILYMIGSVITIFVFLNFHHVLNRFGNYRAIKFFILTQATLLGVMAFASKISFIIPAFVFVLAGSSVLNLCLDIFLEDETATRNTGGTRGVFMTAVNIAWVLSPLFAGLLLDGSTNYRFVYAGSLILILPFAYLIKKNYSKFVDPHYSHATIRATSHKVFHNKDLKKIFTANIILQSFYAWMVIYTPIYLYKYVGFGWDDIGLMFTVMLLPFILVDYPLGKLADKKYGETEIMSIGFLILGASTVALAYINGKNLLVWMAVLFMTRIGAATVEMMIETYFFKKVPEKDLDVLGFFRMTRPAAYIIAPLIATVALGTVGHQAMFITLGTICLCGLYFSLTIRDTN